MVVRRKVIHKKPVTHAKKEVLGKTLRFKVKNDIIKQVSKAITNNLTKKAFTKKVSGKKFVKSFK